MAKDGDQRAFNDLVRIMADDVAVFAGARLGLIGIDDQIMRAGRVDLLGMKLHFMAGRAHPAPPRPRSSEFLTSSIIQSRPLAMMAAVLSQSPRFCALAGRHSWKP
jgi:hypothetical protein